MDENNYSHPKLAYWIPKYILVGSMHKLSQFPVMPKKMKRVTTSQDLIPGTAFMEGILFVEMFCLLRQSLSLSPSIFSIMAWYKEPIYKIIQISHSMDLLHYLSPQYP